MTLLNFRRPFWVFFLISVAMLIFGFVGGYLIPPLFPNFDPKGFMCVPFVLLIFAGVVGCCIALVWGLIATVISRAHTGKSEQGQHK